MSTRIKLPFRTMVLGLSLILGICQLGCVLGNADATEDLPSVASLLDKLNKGDFFAKLEALEGLRKHGPNAKSAVPTLIKILEDDKAAIPGAEEAVKQELFARPEDANPSIRAAAAVTLAAIGPDAKPAIPALLKNLKDKDRFVRGASAKALAAIGSKEEKIIAAFKEALKDPNDINRVNIAVSFARLDPERKEPVAAITNVLLKGKDPGDRSWAALHLQLIGPPHIKKAIQALITALKDPEEEVRHDVAYALGEICEEAETVVPALTERLQKDKSASVRRCAAQALGEFGPEATAAIPALTRAQKDADSEVQVVATKSLEQIKTWTKKRGLKGKQELVPEAKKKRAEFEKRIKES